MGIPAGNCDLLPNWPGDAPTDAPTILGFAAQLGFRVPNIIVSPFTRKHVVFHAPMDHTAVLRFVEDTFIHNGSHLTPRVAASPTCRRCSTSLLNPGPLHPPTYRCQLLKAAPATHPSCSDTEVTGCAGS
ncbi:MAG: alkaline phosphatase family protein [Acidobacteriaceae bacterium]